MLTNMKAAPSTVKPTEPWKEEKTATGWGRQHEGGASKAVHSEHQAAPGSTGVAMPGACQAACMRRHALQLARSGMHWRLLQRPAALGRPTHVHLPATQLMERRSLQREGSTPRHQLPVSSMHASSEAAGKGNKGGGKGPVRCAAGAARQPAAPAAAAAHCTLRCALGSGGCPLVPAPREACARRRCVPGRRSCAGVAAAAAQLAHSHVNSRPPKKKPQPVVHLKTGADTSVDRAIRSPVVPYINICAERNKEAAGSRPKHKHAATGQPRWAGDGLPPMSRRERQAGPRPEWRQQQRRATADADKQGVIPAVKRAGKRGRRAHQDACHL